MTTQQFILTAVGTFAGMWALYWLTAPLRRPKMVKVPVAPGVMKSDGAPSVPATYGKDDLRRDLLDQSLTLEQVMDRCKGMPPEEIEEVAKSLGGDRKAERLAWFALMLKSNAELKVVEPPPGAKPMIVLKGQTVRCPYCGGSGKYGHGTSMSGGFYTSGGAPPFYDPVSQPRGSKCGRCGGHGFVVITGS